MEILVQSGGNRAERTILQQPNLIKNYEIENPNSVGPKTKKMVVCGRNNPLLHYGMKYMDVTTTGVHVKKGKPKPLLSKSGSVRKFECGPSGTQG